MYRETFIHSNPSIEKKWLKLNKNWHEHKIATAKSTIDQHFDYDQNPGYHILKNNMKKTFQQREQNQEIDRQNKLLVQKMSNIIKGKSAHGSRNTTSGFQHHSTYHGVDRRKTSFHSPGTGYGQQSIYATQKTINSKQPGPSLAHTSKGDGFAMIGGGLTVGGICNEQVGCAEVNKANNLLGTIHKEEQLHHQETFGPQNQAGTKIRNAGVRSSLNLMNKHATSYSKTRTANKMHAHQSSSFMPSRRYESSQPANLEQENLKFLKRLQDKKSVYDVQKWEYERRNIERIIQMRTKYSPALLIEQTSGQKPQVHQSRYFEDYELDNAIQDPRGRHNRQGSKRSHRNNSHTAVELPLRKKSELKQSSPNIQKLKAQLIIDPKQTAFSKLRGSQNPLSSSVQNIKGTKSICEAEIPRRKKQNKSPSPGIGTGDSKTSTDKRIDRLFKVRNEPKQQPQPTSKPYNNAFADGAAVPTSHKIAAFLSQQRKSLPDYSSNDAYNSISQSHPTISKMAQSRGGEATLAGDMTNSDCSVMFSSKESSQAAPYVSTMSKSQMNKVNQVYQPIALKSKEHLMKSSKQTGSSFMKNSDIKNLMPAHKSKGMTDRAGAGTVADYSDLQGLQMSQPYINMVDQMQQRKGEGQSGGGQARASTQMANNTENFFHRPGTKQGSESQFQSSKIDFDTMKSSFVRDDTNTVSNMQQGSQPLPVDPPAKRYKPMNAVQFGIPNERKVVHRQAISIPGRAQFDIELSLEKKKFYIVARRKLFSSQSKKFPSIQTPQTRVKMFAKTLFIQQAKQLFRLFDVNMEQMVTSLIKVTNELEVDFTFIDKVMTHMVGLQKDELLQALRIIDSSNKEKKALPTQESQGSLLLESQTIEPDRQRVSFEKADD